MYLESNHRPLFYPEDITYCDNPGCPFTSCARHLNQLKPLKESCVISISNLYVQCRKYVRWLMEET